jgi:hypothetical protein
MGGVKTGSWNDKTRSTGEVKRDGLAQLALQFGTFFQE